MTEYTKVYDELVEYLGSSNNVCFELERTIKAYKPIQALDDNSTKNILKGVCSVVGVEAITPKSLLSIINKVKSYDLTKGYIFSLRPT